MEVKIKGGTIVGVVEEPTPKKEAPKKEKKAKDEK